MAQALGLQAGLEIARDAFNSATEHYQENEETIGWWNDWRARDQRARIEKTFKHGRYSRESRTLGFAYGKWYYCFKQAALKAKGQPLDDEETEEDKCHMA